MPLRMEVDLGPDHIVLDGDPVPPKMGHSPPIFGQTAGYIRISHGT